MIKQKAEAPVNLIKAARISIRATREMLEREQLLNETFKDMWTKKEKVKLVRRVER